MSGANAFLPTTKYFTEILRRATGDPQLAASSKQHRLCGGKLA